MFTIEELTILKMYADDMPDRTGAITALMAALPRIEDDEIASMAADIVKKVTAMSDEEFANIDFSGILEVFE